MRIYLVYHYLAKKGAGLNDQISRFPHTGLVVLVFHANDMDVITGSGRMLTPIQKPVGNVQNKCNACADEKQKKLVLIDAPADKQCD